MKEEWTNISTEIMKEIIDSYIMIKYKNESANQDKTEEDEDEIETIFNFMKSREDDSNLVVYFLLKNYKYNYNKDMYKFIFNHLNDDMINNNFSSIIFVLQNLSLTIFKQKMKMSKKIQTKLN